MRSTRQLHKGGRPNGVFIQALRDAERRVVRVHLTGKRTI